MIRLLREGGLLILESRIVTAANDPVDNVFLE